MIPYFLLIAIPVLFSFIGTKYRVTLRKRVLFETQAACIDAFMLIFLLMLAFRGLECGVDTRQYLRMYNRYSAFSVAEIFQNSDHEYGFKLLIKLVGMIFGSFQMLLCITAGICVIPLWYFYKRESDSQLLTIALFLSVAPFIMYFSGIRQAIAISLGIAAWYAARERRKIRFVLTVLLAMQFHTSAFILFLIYPLYTAKITTRWLWFVIPGMAAVFFLKNTIFNFLLAYLWNEYRVTTETGAPTILLLLILFGAYAYIIPDEQTIEQDTIALRNMLLLSIVIQFFALLHPLAMRMNYYFLVFVPILIPRVAARSKNMFSQIADVSILVMTVYFMYYFIHKVVNDVDSLGIFPYIPFWAE